MSVVRLELAVAVLLTGGLLACGSHPPLSGAHDAGATDGLDCADDATLEAHADDGLGEPIRTDGGRCPIAGAFPDVDGICTCQASGGQTICANPCVGSPTCQFSSEPSLCVDLGTDFNNCGGCGKQCLSTATCKDGSCGPPPTVVRGDITGCTSLRLAVGGGNLFWTDAAHGTVNRMPTAGGAPVVIASAQQIPTQLGLYGDSLYWIDDGAQTLMKASVAGGAPTVVVASPNTGTDAGSSSGINGFTVAPDGTVYISSATHVYSLPAAGGSATKLVDLVDFVDEGVPSALALDGDALVFPVAVTGGIDAVSVIGSPPRSCGYAPGDNFAACRIAVAYGALTDTIFARAGRAYWADNSSQGVTTAVIATGLAKDREPLGQYDFGMIAGLTISGDTAFVTETSGYVLQAPLVPNSVGAPLARAQTRPGAIAADDTDVFWVTQDGQSASEPGTCAIMKTPRPRQ